MGNYLIVASHLQKRIAGRLILRDISFALSRGRILAIYGANGSGKTTLLRILASQWGYSGGHLMRFGEEVPFSGQVDGRIGYLAHESFLYPQLTLEENLRLYGRLWAKPHIKESCERALTYVGLSWARYDRVENFSRGMRQRAALARMMMICPTVWLLDEPYAGLDEAGRALMSQLLTEVRRQGQSVILTTHRPQDVDSLADAIVGLAGGVFTQWTSLHGQVRYP